MKGVYKIYTCPICGKQDTKSKLYNHIKLEHMDYILSKCEEHNLKVFTNLIDALAWGLVWGDTDFRFCPNCGKPFTDLNGEWKTAPVRLACSCGYNQRSKKWAESMERWRETPESEHWREITREHCRELGETYGIQHLMDYLNDESKAEERHQKYVNLGKQNGPKNLYDYNHNEKYKEVRHQRLMDSLWKRETNSDYLIKRREQFSKTARERIFGEAELYIFETRDPRKDFSVVKVGYSRDFFRWRFNSYKDYFNIKEVYLVKLEAQQVLDFEDGCSKTFEHYWIHSDLQNIGRTEWYWAKDLQNILDLAESKGYNLVKTLI